MTNSYCNLRYRGSDNNNPTEEYGDGKELHAGVDLNDNKRNDDRPLMEGIHQSLTV